VPSAWALEKFHKFLVKHLSLKVLEVLNPFPILLLRKFLCSKVQSGWSLGSPVGVHRAYNFNLALSSLGLPSDLKLIIS
jgi:hypothetical protein